MQHTFAQPGLTALLELLTSKILPPETAQNPFTPMVKPMGLSVVTCEQRETQSMGMAASRSTAQSCLSMALCSTVRGAPWELELSPLLLGCPLLAKPPGTGLPLCPPGPVVHLTLFERLHVFS